ncbi:unnamed protein product [Symbiodinium necroappetens]|uniref:Uncharacterized protein n=1 Tax=Symbiodinium necroappetens TaxID=1628268 RepID=A0A812QGU9_9DINO|nr:unnamed protein product [Symbiodinium necroappetens]
MVSPCGDAGGTVNPSEVLKLVEEAFSAQLRSVDERLAKLELCVQTRIGVVDVARASSDAEVLGVWSPDTEVLEDLLPDVRVAPMEPSQNLADQEPHSGKATVEDGWNYKFEGPLWLLVR